jgi:hypothetical protein
LRAGYHSGQVAEGMQELVATTRTVGCVEIVTV